MNSATAQTPSRPLRADAERNRLQILNAARQLMQETGIELVAHEVAHRAGVGVATLYRRFPTRETLIEGVLEEPMRELAQDALDAAKHVQAGEAFFFYMRRLWDAQVRHPGLIQALSLHGFAETARWRSGVSAALRELLTAAQASGAVRPDLSWRDIPFLLAATDGLRREALSLQAGPRQSERLFAIIQAGMAARAGPPLTGHPPTTAITLPDLETYTRHDLNLRAQALGVTGAAKMPREELIERLTNAALSEKGRNIAAAGRPGGWR
jgi:AcrR family transcriptional regulator